MEIEIDRIIAIQCDPVHQIRHSGEHTRDVWITRETGEIVSLKFCAATPGALRIPEPPAGD